MTEFYEYYSKDEMSDMSELFAVLVTDEEMPASFVESAIVAAARAATSNHFQAERLVSMFGNQLTEGKTPGIQVAALGMISYILM